MILLGCSVHSAIIMFLEMLSRPPYSRPSFEQLSSQAVATSYKISSVDKKGMSFSSTAVVFMQYDKPVVVCWI